MEIQSGQNDVIVTMQTKYIRNMSDIMRNAQLDPNNKFNAADLVQIISKVHSAPKTINTNRKDYKGYSVADIRKGDLCLMRFDVVYSFAKQPENDSAVFKNMFWYYGGEYWRVDIQKLFAVIRNDEIIMQNGYVMVEPYEEVQAIILPQHMKRLIKTVSSKVWHIGRPLEGHQDLGVKAFDTVYYNPQKAQHYQMNGKKFCIIKQEQILGIEISE